MATILERYEEHQFKRTIPGNVETVRKRICDALEELDYVVLGDNPIQAKRTRRRNIWIATILEYQTQLTIALKPISDASTLATFDYEVEYLFTKGDRRTLEREAEAIIALATQPPGSSICKTCGIENDTGVRFCRACGTPVGQQPALAEFELMRMSADASAAHIEASVALWIQILVLAVTLSMIFFGPHAISKLGWGMFALGELFVVLVLFQAIHRLKGALLKAPESGDEKSFESVQREARRSLSAQPFSVTEGTTELIDSANAPVGAPSSRDTDSM
jgi:zinc-ribbon domain